MSTLTTQHEAMPGGRRRVGALWLLLVLGLLAAALAVHLVVPGGAWAQTETPPANHDSDGDGLIEISTLAQLNAVRYDLNGDGAADSASNNTAYAAAFPAADGGSVCPSGATCTGYELTTDLDFDTGTSGDRTDDAYYNDDTDDGLANGAGWEPIGSSSSNAFTGVFDGGGHTIANLHINRSTIDYVGLFGYIGSGGEVRLLGLPGVNITGKDYVGGLAGYNSGAISASYATGTVSGDGNVGGLAGYNSGAISASYATGTVSGGRYVGGLVGQNYEGSIRASYASGTVSGDSYVRGLVGRNDGRYGHSGTIRASYASGTDTDNRYVGLSSDRWFGATSWSYYESDRSSGMRRTTDDLQEPKGYTGIYTNWNLDLDNADGDNDLATGGDDPWDFGTNAQYPALKADFNGDNTATWQEFGYQTRRPLILTATASGTQVALSWPDVTETAWPGSPQISYVLYRDGTAVADYDGSSRTYIDTGLTAGQRYTYQVALLLDGGLLHSDGASVLVPATRADADGDGLIDISSLAQLNAVRWDPDGDGLEDDAADNLVYNAAFPAPARGSSCNGGGEGEGACTGYELTADLDFDTGTAGDRTDDAYSNGWQPIGSSYSNSFTGVFDGGGHAIANLYVNLPSTDYVGLFGYLRGEVRNLGLVGVDVRGDGNVGGLAGSNRGAIRASYATGTVSGNNGVGGLAGSNSGTISGSYAAGTVGGEDRVGGLAGSNSGTISGSYATGTVSGDDQVGGLAGYNGRTIMASYATGTVSGNGRVGGLMGQRGYYGSAPASHYDSEVFVFGRLRLGGKSTTALQTPTGYTGIYDDWNLDLDNADGDNDPATGGDDPWDFGTSSQYPVLKADFNGDNTATWQEFGYQVRRPMPLTATPTGTQVALSWPEVTETEWLGSPPRVSYALYRDGAAVTGYDGSSRSHTDTGLTAGQRYTYRVALLVKGLEILSSAASVSMPATRADSDGDGLIEIGSLAQLNAVRWDTDGDGLADDAASYEGYEAAFPAAESGSVCNGGGEGEGACVGYELTADLDFDTGSTGNRLDDAYYNDGKGWIPISLSLSNPFTGVFDGAGHAISNLRVYRPELSRAGLFGNIGIGGEVRRLGLPGVYVIGGNDVGGLAGINEGTISESYATGTVSASYGYDNAGGLVGFNDYGTISASYATGRVSGYGYIGGLAGRNEGTISASYAVGTVAGREVVGGLQGNSFYEDQIRASYFDATVSGLTGDEGKTTSELQTPTGYTGIYADWNLDLDNADGDNDPATGGDDPWDFGTGTDYPTLNAFDKKPTFGQAAINNQSYTENTDVGTVNLPAASGGNGALTYTLTPDLPAGLTFDAAARTITGTPTAPKESAEYTYTVADADGDKVSLTFTIEVAAVPVQTLVEEGATTLVSKSAGETTVTITLGQTSRSIAVSTDAASADAQVTLKADRALDDLSRVEFQEVSDLSTLGTLPAAFSIDSSKAVVNITLRDSEGNRITQLTNAAKVCLPAPTRSPPNNAEWALLHYDSVNGWEALPIIEFRISDGGSGTVLVCANATRFSPFAVGAVTDLEPTFGEAAINNQSYTESTDIGTVNLPAATSGDGALSYTLTPEPPAGLSFDAAARTITGTPTEPQDTTEYTYKVSDADDDTAELTFTIAIANNPPSFGSDAVDAQSYTETVGISTLSLPAATGGDGTLAYTLVPEPPAGLSFDADARTITGTPEDPQGATEYTYKVTDGDGETAELTFTIAVANNPPSFGEEAVQAQVYTENTDAGTVNLPAATGGDGGLSYTLTPDLPAGLSFDPGDRSISGIPSEPRAAENYTYKVTDGDGETAELTFTIEVEEDLEPTFGEEVIDSQVYTQSIDIGTVNLPEATGGDGTLDYALTPDLPAGLSFDPAERSISGTPTEPQDETEYTYTAADADGDETTLTFTIEVGADLTPPTLIPVELVMGPTNDNTPSVVFISSEPGTLVYGGDCGSPTPSEITTADTETTLTYPQLADGEYSGCSVAITDAAGNTGYPAVHPDFWDIVVDTRAPELESAVVAHPFGDIVLRFSEEISWFEHPDAGAFQVFVDRVQADVEVQFIAIGWHGNGHDQREVLLELSGPVPEGDEVVLVYDHNLALSPLQDHAGNLFASGDYEVGR